MYSWKMSGRNISHSASSKSWEEIPMSGVTRFTKSHCSWRECCRPAYAVCWCQRTTPIKVSTKSRHHSIFYPASDSVPPLTPRSPQSSGSSSQPGRGVPGRHDQYALGRPKEVFAQGPSYHQVVQMTLDFSKGDAHPHIIRVPGLGDAGVVRPQFYLLF